MKLSHLHPHGECKLRTALQLLETTLKSWEDASAEPPVLRRAEVQSVRLAHVMVLQATQMLLGGSEEEAE